MVMKRHVRYWSCGSYSTLSTPNGCERQWVSNNQGSIPTASSR